MQKKFHLLIDRRGKVVIVGVHQTINQINIMGWTSFTQTKSDKETAIDELTCHGEKYTWEVIDHSLRGREFYAAVKRTENSTGKVLIYGEVVLLDKKGGEVYVKTMQESCNPYYYNCPKRIIDKLDPTENPMSLEWRAECLKSKATPKIGESFQLKFPLKFTDGTIRSAFKVVRYRKSGKRYQCLKTGIEVKITGLKDREKTFIQGLTSPNN